MTRRSQLLIAILIGSVLGVGAFLVWSLEGGPARAETALATVTTTTLPPSTTSTLPSTTTTPPPTTTTTEPKGTVVIHGTGDVAVDPWYIPTLAAKGYDHAWSGLDGLFLEDDLTVINLECTPSDIGQRVDKTFTFRCPTEALPSIRSNGIDVANMGNNHSQDFGVEALLDGRANLIKAGIGAVGAGKDAFEAGEPALFEINGWTIAVVGFGGVAPHEGWYATVDSPGMRSGDDAPSMARAVAAANEIADIVIVTVHWGYELDTQPRQEDIDRANAMIEAGADIIFGHHQHRLNPLEYLDGKPVFWGLGNFVWPHNSTASATTAIARVVINPDGSMDACMIDAFIKTHGRPEITGEAECGPPL